ncbi:histidine kinase [Micromonospora sp. KC213]|uniref:sensor histidine kinase n=1 Tax=Micromonospora sp. KC213 TaxID=2530378 RepID=UPI001404763A|nr:histidine kinase [Micromonospora sp. KC213]
MRITWAKDAGLAAVVLLAQSAPFLFSDRVASDEPWQLAEYLPVLGSALPVVFRRKAPLLCLVLTELCVGAYGVLGTGPAQPIWYGALVGLYTVANLAPGKHRLIALVVTAVGLLSVVGSLTTAVRELLTWLAAFAIGALARTRQELADNNAAQAAELAAARERTRLAADLHNIVGHAFSMMIVQAEAGAALAERHPQRAASAFDAIAATGRDAMSQLRTTVRGLRNPEAVEPPRGVADLPALARKIEQAGLAVRLHTTGEPRELSPDVHLAAYRVPQEALTNVVKHAQASTVELRTTWTGGGFRLSVADDGVGIRSAGGGRQGSGGHGLIGLRERVAAAGGEVTVGVGLEERGCTLEAVFA